MDFADVRELYGRSTYLSQILEADGKDGKKYVIKRNKGKLTEAQDRFFGWLVRTRPDGFLIPVELTGKVGESSEEIYEFVKWPLLDDVLRLASEEERKSWTFPRAFQLTKQLTSILGVLHTQGFIHHDVRQKNLFVNPNGIELKLFDYNSLRVPYLLERGEGSWNDVPPEYKDGNCIIDFTFDVYQAGKLFFEMTHCSTRDFRGKEPRFTIPPRALEIITKASHPQQKERYPNCNDFRMALCSLEA